MYCNLNEVIRVCSILEEMYPDDENLDDNEGDRGRLQAAYDGVTASL